MPRKSQLFINFFKVTLITIFLALVLRNIAFLNRNETGTKFYIDQVDAIDFPTIYICPFNYNENQVSNVYLHENYTLKDLQNLPKVQEMIQVYLWQLKLYDVSNVKLTVLNDHDDLWQEFFWIHYEGPFKAMKCAEISMPPSTVNHHNKGTYSFLQLSINHSSLGGIQFELRQFGESSLNYKPNWNDMTVLIIPNEHFNVRYSLETKAFKRLGKCVSENQQFHCIQKYLAWKLDCVQPWLEKFTTNQSKHCQMDMKKYFKLQFEIFQLEKEKELEEFGCLKPKCFELRWKANELMGFSHKSLENNVGYQTYAETNSTMLHLFKLTNDV